MSARGARPSAARLLALVEALPHARVMVLGDPVLDEFVFGEIARVSREAPVLILDHRDSKTMPGGAGNTAANLAALGVQVGLCARVGDDERGAALRELLANIHVDVEGMIAERRYVTPSKSRILAGSPHTAKQQIVRLDRGRSDCPLAAGTRRALIRRARAWRRRGAALLVADYGYGSVDPELVTQIGGGDGPMTLDSRFALPAYRGVDAATPNLEELERAAGVVLADEDEAGIVAAARRLRRRLGARALLVTRGSRGMTLLESRRAPRTIPVFGSDEIADVTGAGDTVIAVFTAARAAGGSWAEAAELANIAGGLVVMKRGTATVSREELVQAIEEAHGP
ncbi:MAG TPA: sugar kinase [Acidobacteria bacterium]|nr:sugar kinase [Acidobacteriota bacterium]